MGCRIWRNSSCLSTGSCTTSWTCSRSASSWGDLHAEIIRCLITVIASCQKSAKSVITGRHAIISSEFPQRRCGAFAAISFMYSGMFTFIHKWSSKTWNVYYCPIGLFARKCCNGVLKTTFFVWGSVNGRRRTRNCKQFKSTN